MSEAHESLNRLEIEVHKHCSKMRESIKELREQIATAERRGRLEEDGRVFDHWLHLKEQDFKKWLLGRIAELEAAGPEGRK